MKCIFVFKLLLSLLGFYCYNWIVITFCVLVVYTITFYFYFIFFLSFILCLHSWAPFVDERNLLNCSLFLCIFLWKQKTIEIHLRDNSTHNCAKTNLTVPNYEIEIKWKQRKKREKKTQELIETAVISLTNELNESTDSLILLILFLFCFEKPLSYQHL